MIISGLLFGLFGSLHCLGMCGPIAFILPVDRTHSVRKMTQTAMYHLGRILAYSTMGLAFGIIGKSLNMFGFQQWLSLGVGALLMLSVFFPKVSMNSLVQRGVLKKGLVKLNRKLGQLLKEKNPDTLLTLGYLNGFLPCGLVYAALFTSIAQGSIFNSVLFMALFGLGTVPLMTTAIYLSSWFTPRLKSRLLALVPYFIFIMGLLLFLRGLGLGIPFLSPTESLITKMQVSAVQHCN